MKSLPQEDYDTLVAACDVGMIFLDHRFTIPNFPSRLLSYMQAKLPVLACTDPNTDIGNVIVEGRFGWWGESGDPELVYQRIKDSLTEDLKSIGEKGFTKLKVDYSVGVGYKIINDAMEEKINELSSD